MHGSETIQNSLGLGVKACLTNIISTAFIKQVARSAQIQGEELQKLYPCLYLSTRRMNYSNIYVSDIQQPICDVMYIIINEKSNEDEQISIHKLLVLSKIEKFGLTIVKLAMPILPSLLSKVCVISSCLGTC